MEPMPRILSAARGGTRLSSPLRHHLIGEAPPPGLAQLEGSDDGMSALAPMGGGMTVRGRVTATDMSAGQAQTEMNPAVARGQAFLAAFRRSRVDVLHLDIEVLTTSHVSTLLPDRDP